MTMMHNWLQNSEDRSSSTSNEMVESSSPPIADDRKSSSDSMAASYSFVADKDIANNGAVAAEHATNIFIKSFSPAQDNFLLCKSATTFFGRDIYGTVDRNTAKVAHAFHEYQKNKRVRLEIDEKNDDRDDKTMSDGGNGGGDDCRRLSCDSEDSAEVSRRRAVFALFYS